LSQATLDGLVQHRLALASIETEAVDNVVVDAHREWRGALEEHANSPAQTRDVDSRVIHILIAHHDFALEGERGDQVVDPVEAAEQRGLAASGGTDDRRDL